MPESNDLRLSLRDWIVTGTLPRPVDESAASALAQAARGQGLAGQLHGALVAAGHPWPAAALEALRADHVAAFVRGTRQLELAARAHAQLAARGLRSLPLKGAALAESLYTTVAERPMGDVDLLALDDWRGSVAALEDAGFRRLEAADHAWSFADPLSHGVLELHHSVTSCPGLYPLDRDALWARSRPGSGQVPRLPAPEDLLVHLSLHAAFQHGLVLSLVQWLDLRRLLERQPADVDRIRALAAAARAETPLAATLAVAARTVAAPVPETLREALAPHFPQRLQLRVLGASSLAFVAPSPAAHAAIRWALVPGRRLELLQRTLMPIGPDPPAPFLLRTLGAVVRGGKLLWRWGLPPGAVRGCASDV